MLSTTGTTSGATSSATIGCTGQNHPDVWYRVDSGDATLVSVWLGEAGAVDLGLQVWDGCGGNVVYCADGLLHTFATSTNTTYWLQVYSMTTHGGFTICVSKVDQVTYYSQASGFVSDPIWDVVPAGSPGPATFTPTATMVVQAGHAVMLDGGVDVDDLAVNPGGTLELEVNSTFTVHGDQVQLDGSVTAEADSRLALIGAAANMHGLAAQTLWDLHIGTPGGTTLNSPLRIQGTLRLEENAVIHAGAGLLTLLSNITGTGRLDAVPSTATFTGDLTMERYIPAGATNWRLLGSAVQGRQVVHWHDDFITAGYPGSHYPNFDNPVGSGDLWPSIRQHDEPTVQGTSLAQGTSGVTSTDPLTPGKGFAVWCGDALTGTAAFTIDLKGPPTIAVAPIPLQVSYTDRGEPTLDGWNLVSNPLPSPIAFSAITRVDVNNEYYVYDPASGNMAHWDGSASVPEDVLNGTIASSQGFWLKATAPGASATVDESAKVAGNEGGVFGGSSFSSIPLVRLGITGSANNFSDQTLVYFGPGGPSFETDDVLKMDFAHQQAPSIATLATTGEALMVNRYGSYDADISIPVAVRTKVNGNSVVTMQVANTVLSCMWLEDLVTGSLTVVTDGAQYSFTHTPSQTFQTRFMLHATAPLALLAEDGTCGPMSGSASVDVGAGPVDVTWTTLEGMVLLEQPGVSGTVVCNGIAEGGYTVRVTSPASICAEVSQDFTIQNNGEAVEAAIMAPGTVLVNEAVQFTGTATANATFLWDFGDGTTSTEAEPEHTYTLPGIYTVTLTATLGDCSTSISTTVDVTFTTDVGSLGDVAIRVWGAQESFVVEHGFEGGLLDIEVIDATGRVWYAQGHPAVSGRIIVPAGGIAPGVWLVRLAHDGRQATFRVPLLR
ncbi:MAG: PKD domain-containing protein [Flavobacteriales bacterium]|nr:PKD domain-containing protein [Flavobacteriales bacterium]